MLAPPKAVPSASGQALAREYRKGRTALARFVHLPGTRVCAWMAFIGLMIRYVLAPFTSWPHDVETWQAVAAGSMHHLSLYQRPGFSYPPMWGYLLRAVATALSAVGVRPSALGHDDLIYSALAARTQSYASVITSPLFNLAFKSVLFAFDLATAVLVYRIVLQLTASRRRAAIGFGIWFLNPLVIYESAIHGAFDGIVAFFIVAAVGLLLAKRFLWSGVAIAAGTMTKLSPLLLLPLFVLLASQPVTKDFLRSRAWLRPISVVSGFSAGIVLLALPLAATGDVGNMLNSVFSRVGTSAVVGGFSFWGVRHLAPLFGVFQWALVHPSTVIRISTVVELVSVVAVTAIAATIIVGRDWRLAAVGGACSVMIAVLVTAPLTQPQYLEWMLPLLVVLVLAGASKRWQLAAVSFGPLVFGIGFLGPAALFATLSEWSRLVTPTDIAASVLAWYQKPAVLWGSSFKDDFASTAVVITVPAMLAVWSLLIRRASPIPAASMPNATEKALRLATLSDEPVTPPNQDSRPLGRVAVGLVVLSLSIVALGEIAAYAPQWYGEPTRVNIMSVRRTGDGAVLDATIALARDQENVRLLAVPVTQAPVERRLTVYLDSRYPMSGSDRRSVQGVFDHLSAELAIRHYPQSVGASDAAGLATLLRDLPTARSRAVVIMTGVLPYEVFSRNSDLITPWVGAGGLLIWGGAPIGYYSGHPGMDLDPSDVRTNLGDLGPSLLLGPQTMLPMYVPYRVASAPSMVASALGLNYRSTSYGVRSSTVGTRGTALLGRADDSYSSITSFPIKKGNIVVFGGDIFDEVVVAHDLTRIIMAHVLDAAGPISFQDVNASGSARQVNVKMHVPGLTDGDVLVAAFDPSDDGVFMATFLRQVSS